MGARPTCLLYRHGPRAAAPVKVARDTIAYMADGGIADEIYAEVLDALDGDGALGEVLQLADTLAPLSRALPMAGQIVGAAGQIRSKLGTMARAHQLLSSLGWGIVNTSTTILAEAIGFADRGDISGADEVLAECWDRRKLDTVVKRVKHIGSADASLAAIGRQRWRLLRKAEDHHLEKRYEASVPIVLAQIEGIIADVHEGKLFFSRHAQKKANLKDPSRLVGIRSGLETVRRVFTEGVDTSSAEGRLSRHGILHGRELGYDTEVISAKCWSLLDIVIEWAIPIGAALAQSRCSDALEAHAGSDAIDEHGGRVDRREFTETRAVLDLLSTSQMGWHRQRGAFRPDLVPEVYVTEDFIRRGLPKNHGVHAMVDLGGQAFSAWRRTITGWVLGIALVVEDEHMAEWHYAGAEPPITSPPAAPGWRGGSDFHPDWMDA